MDIKVKPVAGQVDTFEIFRVQILKDDTDKDVRIPRSIGQFTLKQLEAQKALIQEKIDAVKVAKTEMEK